MRVESQTLVANQRTQFRIPGRFFLLIQASTGIDVEFRRNKSLLREKATDVVGGYKSFPGDWSDPDDNTFDEFDLTSAIGQTIIYGVSESAGDYSFLRTLVQIEQPNTIVTVVDITVAGVVVTLAAANAGRREVHIQNVGAGNIRVGDTNVAAARGIQLTPGQAVTLTTTAEIRAIREAVNSTASVTEETRT